MPETALLTGGGGMGRLIARTPLGPPERWPESLHAAVSIRLRRIAAIAPSGGVPRRLLELIGPETQNWVADTEQQAVAAVLAGPRHN